MHRFSASSNHCKKTQMLPLSIHLSYGKSHTTLKLYFNADGVGFSYFINQITLKGTRSFKFHVFCLLDGFIEFYSSVIGLVGRHQGFLFFRLISQNCYISIKEHTCTILQNIKKVQSTRRIGRIAMHLPNDKWSSQNLETLLTPCLAPNSDNFYIFFSVSSICFLLAHFTI